MPNEKKQIEEIIDLISTWVARVGTHNAMNYYDINKTSEGTCLQLLNLIYNYNLVDLNRIKANYPGVDLGELENSKIAFQVTSRSDISKIRETVKLFKAHNLQEIFPGGLKIFIISNNKVKGGIIRESGVDFDTKKNILYPSNLIKEIQAFYRTDHRKFLTIKEFLQHEFGVAKQLVSHKSIIDFPDNNQRLEYYKNLYKQVTKEETSHFVHFSCVLNGDTISTERLHKEVLNKSGVVIVGKSGCGKSVLAKILSLGFLVEKRIALFLEAKYYESGLNSLVNKEVQSLGFPSAIDFIKTCQNTETEIWIIIDGLNECLSLKRNKLITELIALVRLYSIKYLVSTQELDATLESLGAAIISVELPVIEVKRAIAEKYGSSIQKLEPILTVVSTSLEARMIGEIGAFNIENVSRFKLFELFVRKKLASADFNAFVLLSLVARKLSENLSFSLSLRNLEAVIADSQIPFEAFESAVDSRLIVQSLTKISFAHEMLMNFFIADSIARFSPDSLTLIRELTAPKNYDNKLLIIGSIENTETLVEVLESINDTNLLTSLIGGDGGEIAKKWAGNRLLEVIEKIETETQGIVLEITSDEWTPVQVKADTLLSWTDQELAFVYVLPTLLYDGQFLEEIFDITNIMDNVCDKAFKELLDEGREKKISLRSQIFSNIYIGLTSKQSALTRIFSTLHSGFVAFNHKNEIKSELVSAILAKGALKNGQFYLLLLILRYGEKAQLLFSNLLDAITLKWRIIPYHLKIEILDKIRFCYVSEDQRIALIESLTRIHGTNENAWVSSSIFEALSALGALDDDAIAYVDTVDDQIERLLSEPESNSSKADALSIFDSQFDHPYDSAFYKAIEKLSPEKKFTFYKIALQANKNSIFTASLILTASDVMGSEICPLLLRYIEPPSATDHFPQESLAVFIIVHILLAKFGYSMQSRYEGEENHRDRSLLSCAEIYHWLNRNDLAPSDKKDKCKRPAQELFVKNKNFTVEAIWQAEHSLMNMRYSLRLPGGGFVSIGDSFSNRIAAVCRFAISDQKRQKGIFNFDRTEEIIKHAIELLQKHGDVSDLVLLKSISSDHVYGESAVRAIKSLEG